MILHVSAISFFASLVRVICFSEESFVENKRASIDSYGAENPALYDFKFWDAYTGYSIKSKDWWTTIGTYGEGEKQSSTGIFNENIFQNNSIIPKVPRDVVAIANNKFQINWWKLI